MRNPTGYYRPQSIAEAVALLTQKHIRTVSLAGGALRLASEDDLSFEAVVDLQGLDELSAISEIADGRLFAGANVSLDALVNHPACPEILQQAVLRVIPWNRRNGISVTEIVDSQSEFAEVTAVLQALSADIVTLSPDEQRTPFDAMLGTEGVEGLVKGLELPSAMQVACWGMAQVARTPSDEAIVSAAAVLDIEAGRVTEVRLALSGVWAGGAQLSHSVNLLLGMPLDEESVAGLLHGLEQEVASVGDYLGSAAYRRAMAVVLARRALAQCRARLG